MRCERSGPRWITLTPAVADLGGAACGGLLIALGEVQAKLTAAHARLLRRFDAADGHDADGYGSSSAWLAAKAGMSKGAARASVRQMRQLGDRPLLDDALADGGITDSLAFTIAGWTRKLPAGMRDETDRILLEAAAAGASLDDLATIAACAIERWRQQQPDPESPDDGFDDRFVQVGTTFGGAGVIRGNLTPECAAAVRAVVKALGKKAGREDDRDEGKRFHDALQLACALWPRANGWTRWAQCRGGSRLGERLNGDVRIRRGKRREVIRVAGEHNAAAGLHRRRDHVRVGEVTRVRFRAGQHPADQARQRAVGVADPDSRLAGQAGVYRLVMASAPVQFGEDDRRDDHVSLHERGGSHSGPDLLLPTGGPAA